MFGGSATRVERLRGYDKLPDRDACCDGRSFQGGAAQPSFAGGAGLGGLGTLCPGRAGGGRETSRSAYTRSLYACGNYTGRMSGVQGEAAEEGEGDARLSVKAEAAGRPSG